MKLPPIGRTATAMTAALATSASSSKTTTTTRKATNTTTIATAAASCPASHDPKYQDRISNLAQAIHPKVLATTRGSGNHGESGAAHFYILDQLPPALSNMQSSSSSTTSEEKKKKKKPLERLDVDLGTDRTAFVIDHVLTPEEADAMAACAEAILEHNGHSRMAPGIQTPPGMRINEAAHWYPSQEMAPLFLGTILDRIRHLVPETLPDSKDLPLYPKLSEKVAQFKYNPGDEFNRHIDGLFPGQGVNPEGSGVEEWTGVVSGFSMLFYLNDRETDGLEGGETRLWTADQSRHVDIQPQKGRVLCFRRGSPTAVLHAGLPVRGQVPKYMALINLAYGEHTGTRPMRM